MSDNGTTLDAVGDYRVTIYPDYYPEPPYDDGSSPIVEVTGSIWDERYRAAQRTDVTSYVLDTSIIGAIEHFGTATDSDGTSLVERYLRIFHGVTKILQYRAQDGTTYLTFDPADWRDRMGLTDDWLAAHPDVDTASMTEWVAYCEGDVWGYAVERLTTWVDADHPDHTMESWEIVDSCCGFYGYEYAEESAREAFAPYQTDVKAVTA